jgi:hypothetical protein
VEPSNQEDSVASFCPFVGSDCVEDKCKFWRDGDCLIPTFLSTSIVRNIQELSREDDDFEEDEVDEDDLDDEDFEEIDEDEDDDEDDDEDEDDKDDGIDPGKKTK